MRTKQQKLRYYVGISGHRDLKKSNIERYKKLIQEELKEIVHAHPDQEVIILSPLADGADRLMVYVAKELDLDYEVLLPMPKEFYELDFDMASKKEFYTLFYRANGWRMVDLCDGCSLKGISKYGEERDRQYQKVGVEIVERSDHVFFLWDGEDNSKTAIGGTADIYNYAMQKNKSYDVIECEREEKKGR